MSQDKEREAWRDLALQFDGHRMQALGWLRLIAKELPKNPDWADLYHFLASPPLSGEAVLAERIAALASQQAVQGEPVADVVRNAEPPCSGVRWLVKPLPVGTRLYASPPQVDEKPVAWRSAEQYSPDVGSWYEYYDEFRSISPTDGLTPLFASPPSREPLTDDAILDAFCHTPGIHQFVQAFKAGARFAERAHGIHSREGGSK